MGLDLNHLGSKSGSTIFLMCNFEQVPFLEASGVLSIR